MLQNNSTLFGMCKSIVGMANINAQELQNINISIPPIELQTQFAQIVGKTEALKAQYQQSLQELENLYGSLSQRAFRGELTVAGPVQQKQANISDKALLAFYQKQIIGHVIKKHQEHRMEQGEMVLAKDLYHLEALYGIKTHFQFKNWHYGTYDNKIRQLINGKDKFFTKKSVGQKGFQVLALGEKSEALFAHKYVEPELEHIDKAMDELLDLYASFPFKQRSHKIELLNTVCKSMVDVEVANDRFAHFNSTLVRLTVLCSCLTQAGHPDFNSTLVRLTVEFISGCGVVIFNFNSTLVRLTDIQG